MAVSDGFEGYARHVNPPLARFLALSGRDYRFTRAEGGTLWTDSGEAFSDWISGFGALSFGHNPPFVRAALRRQAESQEPCLFVESMNPASGALARAIVERAGGRFETCFFASSGSEAVEAGLKTALLCAGRPRVLYAAGGYHGTTLGALACMADGLYRDPFRDVLSPVFQCVPFADVGALERELAAGDVAGFLLEPVQMEAGARIAPAEYLRAVRALCDRHGTLLLFDEIQTGIARTGRLFAFEHFEVAPDILLLGKALGAGVVPISAAVMADGIWNRAYGSVLRTEITNSTMGGNRLCAEVALCALEQASEPEFLRQVAARGRLLRELLDRAIGKLTAVKRISLIGLLGGIELRDVSHPWASWSSLGLPELEPMPVSGALVAQRLARHHVLTQLCGHDWSVVRIEPPLTVSEQDCRDFVDALAESISWLESNAFD